MGTRLTVVVVVVEVVVIIVVVGTGQLKSPIGL